MKDAMLKKSDSAKGYGQTIGNSGTLEPLANSLSQQHSHYTFCKPLQDQNKSQISDMNSTSQAAESKHQASTTTYHAAALPPPAINYTSNPLP